MDRQKILIRIVGPLPLGTRTLRWEFVFRRRKDYGKESFQARRFLLTYDPISRTFTAHGKRRTSKRKKREDVVVSKKMTAYLVSRLLPQHIAYCTAASITAQPRADIRTDPAQWAMQNLRLAPMQRRPSDRRGA